MTTTTAATAVAGASRHPGVPRQLLIDSAYVFSGLPIALANFVVVVAGVSLGTGLLVTVVGIPVLAGALRLARFFADLERLRIPAILRRPRVRPAYREPRPGAGRFARVLIPIADGQSWLDATFGFLRLIVSLFSFAFVLTWWVGAIAGLLYPLFDWAIPHTEDNTQLHEILGMSDTPQSRIGLNLAIGAFFALTLPLVARGMALLEASFARGLLTGVAEVRDRITVLEERRAAAVSAEANALRRLERDIHDGPQQRLVRLAMDLGRVQEQMHTDLDAARQTIDDALSQTRETLNELRALSRGIAPPVLTDRGLPSALAALAGRSAVPVELSVDPALGAPEGRLDAAVENAAYFVVAETLANVNKHSRAGECWLTVTREPKALRIVVIDDGVGGAHLAKGHGLAGLADRVHATGGQLDLTSPAGGPTEIRVELPC
ncbi:sensor histidine kinase [Rhizomonospora bruguierae]|uniref:sensor histidine kinase n=1 Tax=Rhizomonospora bruguierae TaxID=1581705 RepID=UPI001BCFD92F|nr:sensor histidine kinase [Micromonospora sp. NBRC 107566]